MAASLPVQHRPGVFGLLDPVAHRRVPDFQTVKEASKGSQDPIIHADPAVSPKNILMTMGCGSPRTAIFYIITFALTFASRALDVNTAGHSERRPDRRALRTCSDSCLQLVGRLPGAAGGSTFWSGGLRAHVRSRSSGSSTRNRSCSSDRHRSRAGRRARRDVWPAGGFFSELFDTEVRYTGISLGYHLASIFAGALSPLIATSLMAAYKPETWPDPSLHDRSGGDHGCIGIFRDGDAHAVLNWTTCITSF